MNRMFEQRLGDTGIPTVFLRAAYFMENWTPLIGAAVDNGTLPTFLSPPQHPIWWQADVGRIAAALLQEESTNTSIVTLSGAGRLCAGRCRCHHCRHARETGRRGSYTGSSLAAGAGRCRFPQQPHCRFHRNDPQPTLRTSTSRAIPAR
jgi:hypothetical protein